MAIALFLALAFGLGWAAPLALLASGGRFDAPSTAGTLALVVAMFAPGVAALLTRRLVPGARDGDLGWRPGPWRPYAVVWLGAPLAALLVHGTSWLLGWAAPDPGLVRARAMLASLAPDAVVPSTAALVAGTLAGSLTIGLAVTTLATLGEELGWTGWLLPRLLRHGRWRAAVTYGALWGLWHWPMIRGGHNYPAGHPLGPVAMGAFTIALALWQTALRLRYRSVLLTAFLHAAVNAQGRGIAPLLLPATSPFLGGITGLTGIVLLGLGGAWFLSRTGDPARRGERRAAGRSPTVRAPLARSACSCVRQAPP